MKKNNKGFLAMEVAIWIAILMMVIGLGSLLINARDDSDSTDVIQSTQNISLPGKVRRLSTHKGVLFAVFEDGSVWMKTRRGWIKQ